MTDRDPILTIEVESTENGIGNVEMEDQKDMHMQVVGT